MTVYYFSVFLGSSGRAEFGIFVVSREGTAGNLKLQESISGSDIIVRARTLSALPPVKALRHPLELKKYQTNSPCPRVAIGSTAQRVNGSTAPAVTTYFAHKINNITSPAPGKPAPMVYPSTRRDSQRCPTKAEGRTMAKQCKAIRPNPSGQPQEPCSHGPSRPVAAGAPAGQRRVRVYMPQTPPSPFQSNGVTHRLQPRPATTAETRTVPACPIPFGEASTGRRPNTANTPITKQTHRAPKDSNQNTYDANARAPRQINAAPPPGESPKIRRPVGHFGTFAPAAKTCGLL
jgi:hypothetical protein